jgi:aryl-alcohol dehydrogenase-like predicted oxidoreductase
LKQWDTSNNYSNGVSEEIFGKAIKHYNIPRHKILILTKCWAPVSEHENTYVVPFAETMREDKEYVNQFGKSFASSTIASLHVTYQPDQAFLVKPFSIQWMPHFDDLA